MVTHEHVPYTPYIHIQEDIYTRYTREGDTTQIIMQSFVVLKYTPVRRGPEDIIIIYTSMSLLSQSSDCWEGSWYSLLRN